MDWKIEVIPVPVADVDQARDFYVEQMGFTVDVDHTASETMRFVQLTPPGSGCSIVIGVGTTQMEPGSLLGVQLVVDDIHAARQQLVDRGAEVGPVFHFEGSEQVDGPGEGWNSFLSLADPDGNRWIIQQRATG